MAKGGPPARFAKAAAKAGGMKPPAGKPSAMKPGPLAARFGRKGDRGMPPGRTRSA